MYIPNEVNKLMELDSKFKDKFSKQLKETTEKCRRMVEKIYHPETSSVPMIEPFIFEKYKIDYKTKNLNINANVLLGSEASEPPLFIPPEITEIAENAFPPPKVADDFGFMIVLSPTGLKKIGKRAFTGSFIGILDVKDPELFVYSGGWRGGHFGQLSKDVVLFPETLEEIGESAFAMCSNFAASALYMILPRNLKKVSEQAFYACSSLKGVYFNGPKEVERACFDNCSSLENVVLDDCVETIRSYAFSSCCKLTKIIFSSNLKKIEDSAFFLSGLKTLILPLNLEYIGEKCFDSCRRLIEVDMPDSVRVIGKGTFESCTQLRKVQLSNSLSVIPQECFAGCKRMEDIVIPDNVTRIENKAFGNCKSLVSIIIPENVISIDKSSFEGCNYEQLVIYGVHGSYAEQFAKEQNIKFEDIKNKRIIPTTCEACGAELNKDSNFCHKCGAKIVGKPFA